jgi:hypothetical protein
VKVLLWKALRYHYSCKTLNVSGVNKFLFLRYWFCQLLVCNNFFNPRRRVFAFFFFGSSILQSNKGSFPIYSQINFRNLWIEFDWKKWVFANYQSKEFAKDWSSRCWKTVKFVKIFSNSVSNLGMVPQSCFLSTSNSFSFYTMGVVEIILLLFVLPLVFAPKFDTVLTKPRNEQFTVLFPPRVDNNES